MATKANLITALNGFISAVVGITKHRNANNAIVDEIYPNSIIDNQTTETYTEAIGGNNISYSIAIVKSGNISHISGSFENGNNFIISNRGVFTWLSNEFTPNSDTSLNFLGIDNLGNPKKLFMNNSVLSLEDSLDALGTVYFDFTTYITQD